MTRTRKRFSSWARQATRQVLDQLLSPWGYRIVRVEVQQTDGGHGWIIESPEKENRLERYEEYYAHPGYIVAYLSEDRIAFLENVVAQLVDVLGEDGLDGARVLDAGCGPAHVLHLLQARHPVEPHALDWSTNIRSHVVATVPDVQFKVGDICAMDYPDECFDVVICTEVLEHLHYPGRALRELWRVTKGGGTILITVPDGRKDTSLYHLNFFSLESLKVFVEPYPTIVTADFSHDTLLTIIRRPESRPGHE